MSTRPNLLFIMPDQLRHDFLSCYGADFIDTPHIDALATEGVLYERAYSPTPVCVPARAMLLTGQDALKTGVLHNNLFLRPDLEACGIQTWPQLLSKAGYATAAIGKMHFYPWDSALGFEHRVICEDKRWLKIEDDYHDHLAARGLRKLHGNEHEDYQKNRGAIVNRIPKDDTWDAFVGQQTCQYLAAYDDERPFALMVGFPGPHCPYDPPPEYLEGFDPEAMPDPIPAVDDQTPKLRQSRIDGNKAAWNGVDYSDFTTAHKKKIRAHYAALVKQIDDQVGAIVQTLRATGQLEDTAIVFCSDHGDHLGDHGLIGKSDYYESSTRVPLIVRLPGGTAATEDLASIGDITATLLGLAGLPVPFYMDARPLHGLGLEGSAPRRDLCGVLSSGCMSFDGEWKLVKYTSGEAVLFNLAEDPQEQRNRIGDTACQQIYRRLDTQLTQYMLRAVTASHAEKLVGHGRLFADDAFGRKGWQRRYPQPLAAD